MMNIKTYVKPEMEIIKFDLDVRTNPITVSGPEEGSGDGVPLPGENWDDLLQKEVRYASDKEIRDWIIDGRIECIKFADYDRNGESSREDYDRKWSDI